MTTNSLAAFLSACLAPLPPGEEAADHRRYLRDLETDKSAGWHQAMYWVREHQAAHTLACMIGRRTREANMPDQVAAWRAWRDAVREQCLIPAPTAKEYRWKRRTLLYCDFTPAVHAVLAADMERLGIEAQPKTRRGRQRN